MARSPAFLFDLDGTLVDSVYQHVLAWKRALENASIPLSVWRIHRRIGMSGGLFITALARELGCTISDEDLRRIQSDHSQAYAELVAGVRPLPGANALIAYLTDHGIPWAIATSGRRSLTALTLRALDLPPDAPVITRDDVEHAKPDPDLFLAAAARLGMPIGDCLVVGDSVWDILASRRASTLGIGLLSGGYGLEELQSAGAYRVYEDPADLLHHLDEVGVRP